MTARDAEGVLSLIGRIPNCQVAEGICRQFVSGETGRLPVGKLEHVLSDDEIYVVRRACSLLRKGRKSRKGIHTEAQR